jgi:hypothetical protein
MNWPADQPSDLTATPFRLIEVAARAAQRPPPPVVRETVVH